MSNDASENGISTGDLCGGEALDNSGTTEETQSLLSLFEFSPIGDYLRENLKYPFDMGFFVETQDENEKGRKGAMLLRLAVIWQQQPRSGWCNFYINQR